MNWCDASLLEDKTECEIDFDELSGSVTSE
jgi:hypothetical protein